MSDPRKSYVYKRDEPDTDPPIFDAINPATPQGNIAYWRERAERAEAELAGLKDGLAAQRELPAPPEAE